MVLNPLVNAYKQRLQENYQRVLGMISGSSLRFIADVFGQFFLCVGGESRIVGPSHHQRVVGKSVLNWFGFCKSGVFFYHDEIIPRTTFFGFQGEFQGAWKLFHCNYEQLTMHFKVCSCLFVCLLI